MNCSYCCVFEKSQGSGKHFAVERDQVQVEKEFATFKQKGTQFIDFPEAAIGKVFDSSIKKNNGEALICFIRLKM